jgi:hypothetical protein
VEIDVVHRRVLFLTGVSSCVLAGCSALPAGEWRTSLESVGHRTFIHITCTGDGIGRLLLGSLQSGLEGAVIGIGYTGDLMDSSQEDKSALALVGTAASIGGGIGLGMGAGQALFEAPKAYGECLKNQKAVTSPPPRI